MSGTKKEWYFRVARALVLSYGAIAAAWYWDKTSPLGFWTLKPRTSEERALAHLYEHRQFPYPNDKEAIADFVAKGGGSGTQIGLQTQRTGVREVTEPSSDIRVQLQREKTEKEAEKLWLRMKREAMRDLLDQGFDLSSTS